MTPCDIDGKIQLLDFSCSNNLKITVMKASAYGVGSVTFTRNQIYRYESVNLFPPSLFCNNYYYLAVL